MKPTKRDYTIMTLICLELGLVQYKNRMGIIQEGQYSLDGLHAPIDLSACAQDKESILKTALWQLSVKSDEAYHQGIERDLQD